MLRPALGGVRHRMDPDTTGGAILLTAGLILLLLALRKPVFAARARSGSDAEESRTLAETSQRA